MADVNPGLAAQAENGATVIGVNPNAIVQEDVAPPRVERISRPGGPKTLPERWQEVAERVNELSPLRKLLLAVSILLVAVTVFLVAMSGENKDDYKVLFSNVNDKDGAAIVAALEQMKVPHKFTEGGGAIMVPGDKVYDARLKLAGQGLPKAGNVGFEVLENQKLGTSQFVEQVNYQRALESELSNSIKTLAQVRDARVHLAIPKTSAFLRDQPKPTASVVLSLHPGRVVDDQQTTAITHLVSSSVPQLLPAMVTVVDSDGGLLAPNPNKGGASGMDAAQIKYVGEVENQVARRIVTILEPITGRDNVRAQVAVDVDFTQSERAEEIFKPNSGQNPASIRSQQNLEASGPVTSAGGIPGALTNQPPQGGQAPIEGQPAQGQAQPPGTQSPVSTNANRKEQTVNYEVDRAIQTVRGPRASVKRVSSAVIVNFKKTTDADGNVKETAYTQQEIQQMTSLVRDAMGFSQQRGDSVSVVSIPFSPPVSDEPPFWKQATFASVMKEFFKFLIIATVLGLVTVFLVRPILFPPPPKVVEEEQRIEEEFDERVKAELQAMSPAAREKRRLELELERERRRIQEEEERQRLEEERRILEDKRKREEEEKAAEYEELLAYAKEFVQKDPRVVAAIFKQWLQEDVEKGLA